MVQPTAGDYIAGRAATCRCFRACSTCKYPYVSTPVTLYGGGGVVALREVAIAIGEGRRHEGSFLAQNICS